MPLPTPEPREEIHLRQIEMRGFRRRDGLFELEGRITDRKPRDFVTFATGKIVPGGVPMHDMSVRLVIDEDMTVHDAIAVSDGTPFNDCAGGADPIPALKGARIGTGWRREVTARVGGTKGCTHIVELLFALGTTAFQTLVEPRRKKGFPRNAAGVPILVDSCRSYARDREIVALAWPEISTAPKK